MISHKKKKNQIKSLENVHSVKVLPGIGVARVGNSEPHNHDRDFFYLGPEEPNGTVHPPDGPYKDSMGRILRQAQRFRVFAYDADGSLKGEIVDGDMVNGKVVQVKWTAHLTNMKSANYAFQGQYGFSDANYRNSNIDNPTPGTDPRDRRDLIIDPGPISIMGINQKAVELLGSGSTIFDVPDKKYTLPDVLAFDPPQTGDGGQVEVTYKPVTVSLGKLYTDLEGRLIVVGGVGASGSRTTPEVVISKVKPNKAKPNSNDDPQFNGNSYFNNPGWFDDTAGGSIDVEILSQADGNTLFNTKGNAGQTGWLAVAPPKFAPTAYNIVSLLDLQLDMFPSMDPYTGKGPVYFALTGDDHQPYIAASSDGSPNFQPATHNGPMTNLAGSIAVFKGKVYYAITGLDNRPFIGVSENGAPGSFQFHLVRPTLSHKPTFTAHPPALAVFNDRLSYAVTDTDNKPCIGHLPEAKKGEPPSYVFDFNHATSQETSTTLPPALSAYKGRLYYAFIGTDSRPYIGASDNVSHESFNFQAAGAEGFAGKSGTALMAFKGQLYYALIDSDGRPNIAMSTTGAGDSFTFLPASQTYSLGTSNGPALTAFNNMLYYGITGSDSLPYLAVSSSGDTGSFDFQAVEQSLKSDQGPALATREPVSFHRDILPILKIATDYAWTSVLAFQGHRPGAQGDFLRGSFMEQLADPTGSGTKARVFVFNFIRPPAEPTPTVPPPPQSAPPNLTARQVQRGELMPRLTGNGGSTVENTDNSTNFPNQWLSLTNHQMSKLERWVNGDFITGIPGHRRWDDLPADLALSFAALQPTVGGGFHPGIELTYLMQEPTFFDQPFRFAGDTQPGSIAAYMSVPWQGDFWSCNTTFWPAARPDISVFSIPEGDLQPKAWFRGSTIPPNADMISRYENGYRTMATDWPKFGFVVPVVGQKDRGEQVYKEIERDKSLDKPSVLISVNQKYAATGRALAAKGTTVVSKRVNPGKTAQQWRLEPSTTLPTSFLIVSPSESGKVLTVADNSVSLQPQTTPYERSQLWQYLPSGKLDPPGQPGVFYLRNSANNHYLSFSGDSVVTAAFNAGGTQRFQLTAAE